MTCTSTLSALFSAPSPPPLPPLHLRIKCCQCSYTSIYTFPNYMRIVASGDPVTASVAPAYLIVYSSQKMLLPYRAVCRNTECHHQLCNYRFPVTSQRRVASMGGGGRGGRRAVGLERPCGSNITMVSRGWICWACDYSNPEMSKWGLVIRCRNTKCQMVRDEAAVVDWIIGDASDEE